MPKELIKARAIGFILNVCKKYFGCIFLIVREQNTICVPLKLGEIQKIKLMNSVKIS